MFLVAFVILALAATSKIYVNYNMMGNNITNASWINATNFSGGIDCSDIVGNPDTDFCTDADTGAAEVDPRWSGNYTAFNDSWSTTWNSTYDALVSGNASWNETRGQELYIELGDTFGGDVYGTYDNIILDCSDVEGIGLDCQGELLKIAWSEVTLADFNVTDCADNNVLKVSGADWACEADVDTTITEVDPLWAVNYSNFNDSWSTTYNSSYLESYTEYDPAWATNYSAFNDSWATTWNSTYDAYIVADSAGLWDALDTPADINAADITDDDTYALVAGETFTGDLNTSAFNHSGCGTNQILKVSGINWICAADADTADTTCDTGDAACTFDDDTMDLSAMTFTNSLLWGNLTGYDLNVDWSGGGKLGGANITDNTLTGTQIAELTDADISNTLTCSILTDDDTYALVAGETFTGDVTVTGWTNSTDVNTSNAVYTQLICFNMACTRNITDNSTNVIIYG